MPILQRPAVVRPMYHRAAAVRPAYHPAARPYVAPRVVTRTVYTPGPQVTRNFYHTTYVNRGFSPEQRHAYEEGFRRRRYDELIAQGLSAQVAAAQAQAYAAQQALQQQQLQAQQAILNPQQTQAAVSPGSPGADLGPSQDQAAADAGGGDDGGGGGGHHKHMLLFGGILAGVAVVGYMALKKHKKKSAE